jgi:protein ImuA
MIERVQNIVPSNCLGSEVRWQTGVSCMDSHLASGILSLSGLHEIEPLRSTDTPWLTGFAFALLARLQTPAPIVWCVTRQQVGDHGSLYAHGAERYGLSPSQIVFCKVDHPLHLHFALEEALKTEGVAAVMGEGPLPSFTGSRRLSLLTKTHQKPCLLLNPQAGSGRGSAAQTRWQVKPIPGETDPLDPFGPGLPTWLVALARVRGGHPSSHPWRVVWDEQTHSFREAAAFRGGAVQQERTGESDDRKAMVG